MAKSFATYFQLMAKEEDERVNNTYIKNHYDTAGFCSGGLSREMLNRNIISRVRNCFIAAVNQEILFPKAIIIILENDVIKAANQPVTSLRRYMEPLIQWLGKEHHQLTSAYKEKLPSKARKFKFPTFLWIQAVSHKVWDRDNNKSRSIFNEIIEEVADKYKEMQTLQLHSWDQENVTSLIGKNGDNLSSQGLTRYWEAINDTYQAWDKEQMHILHARNMKISPHRTTKVDHHIDQPYHQSRYDRYHWKSTPYRNRLPTPPPS